MIPLHPDVVELFAEWTATNSEHIRHSRRLLADHHDPIDRRTVHRIVARIGAIAGIDDMHPHRLRHTLATQAINRGMRLEAIAALLGHRSLEMTLVYAKITDRVVADEYAAVCEQIDALYARPAGLKTDGNGSAGMDGSPPNTTKPCSATDGATGPPSSIANSNRSAKPAPTTPPTPPSTPVLQAQRDHAAQHDQHHRVDLFQMLIDRNQHATP